jgi:hypothetical protein
MPTFPTTGPVAVVVDLTSGGLRVVASERDDAVVTVVPANPDKPADVRLAESTRVELTDGVLTVASPRDLRLYLPVSTGSIAVAVEVPTGSSLRGRLSAGSLDTEGRLGAVDVTLSAGNARIEDAERLDVKASAGSIVAGHVAGPATVRASAGSVRIREIGGESTIRSANGDTTIGSVTGTLTVSGAHGDILVGRVAGSLVAKASTGSLRVERVESGSVQLTTSYGSVEVGVPEGTAALVDMSSKNGAVRNQLQATAGPVADDAVAEVHASTSYGNVVVRRPDPFIF